MPCSRALFPRFIEFYDIKNLLFFNVNSQPSVTQKVFFLPIFSNSREREKLGEKRKFEIQRINPFFCGWFEFSFHLQRWEMGSWQDKRGDGAEWVRKITSKESLNCGRRSEACNLFFSSFAVVSFSSMFYRDVVKAVNFIIMRFEGMLCELFSTCLVLLSPTFGWWLWSQTDDSKTTDIAAIVSLCHLKIYVYRQ